MTTTRPPLPETIYVPRPWQYDPTRAGTLAVLYGDRVLFYSATDHRIPSALAYHTHSYLLDYQDNLVSLAKLLLGMRVETLLIVPTGDARDLAAVRDWLGSAPVVCAMASGYDLHAHILPGKDLTATYAGIVFQAAGGGPLLTAYAAHSGIWGLMDALDTVDDAHRAQAVANSWLLAQWALGLRLRFSPSHMGQLGMRVSLAHAVAKNPARFAPLPDAWLDRLAAVPAQYFHWYAPENAARGAGPDAEAVHIWTYDRNWSFVSSARVVPLGVPSVVANELAMAALYGEKLPGVYHIADAHAPEPESGRLAPGYFMTPDGTYPAHVRDVWAWSPQVNAAIRAGWRVHVDMAYAFPDKHDLRPWQDAMWTARRRARAAYAHSQSPWQRAAAQQAEAMIKRAGVAGIGRLNQRSGYTVAVNSGMPAWQQMGPQLDAQETELLDRSRDMLRPEWWSSIISGASERLIHTLRAYAGLGLAGYIDAAYFPVPLPELATRGPDAAGGWHEEAAGVMVPREALDAGLAAFVGTVARGKRAGRVTHAN